MWPGAEFDEGEAKDAHWLWQSHAEEPFQLEKGEKLFCSSCLEKCEVQDTQSLLSSSWLHSWH